MLFIGDNAYPKGDPTMATNELFIPFADWLTSTPFYTVVGNHDFRRSNSDEQNAAFFGMFEPPRNGESGGFPSHTSAYYSFKWGNIHFCVLDSYDSSLLDMVEWLRLDLERAVATSEWLIVLVHHPVYTGGFHDTDNLHVEEEELQLRTV